MAFSFPEQPLEGKTVLVAGGTGGLGAACTWLLLKRGARVLAGYRAQRQRAEALREAAEREFGPGSLALLEGDITEEAVRRSWVEEAVRRGPLYGAVMATGDAARVGLEELSEEDLLRSLRRNYTAPLLLARQAARAIRAGGESGALVFIASMQATAVFESGLNYAAPKAALVQAARMLAKRWGGPGGIRVNVVAPGVNRAGMALASIESGKYDVFLERGIIARFGRPEDVARVVALLMEPDNYITAQTITVDGGLTLRRDRG